MPKDEQKKMIAESMKVLPSADIDWVEISKLAEIDEFDFGE